jgi:hypothetical protein
MVDDVLVAGIVTHLPGRCVSRGIPSREAETLVSKLRPFLVPRSGIGRAQPTRHVGGDECS